TRLHMPRVQLGPGRTYGTGGGVYTRNSIWVRPDQRAPQSPICAWLLQFLGSPEQDHQIGERESHVMIRFFLILVAISVVLGCEGGLRTEPSVPQCTTRSNVEAEPPHDTVIAGINVAGEPVKVWDHANKAEPLNLSDGPVSAWREADGTVNLMLPSYEAYRLRGPNLEHLTLDPRKVYSSTAAANQIPEDQY